jgi:hypothetical protein
MFVGKQFYKYAGDLREYDFCVLFSYFDGVDYTVGILEYEDKFVVEDSELNRVEIPKFKGKRRKGRRAKAFMWQALDKAYDAMDTLRGGEGA